MALTPSNQFTIVSVAPLQQQLQYDVDANGRKITNLAAPVNANDAARKVDTEGITLPIYTSNGVFNVSLSK